MFTRCSGEQRSICSSVSLTQTSNFESEPKNILDLHPVQQVFNWSKLKIQSKGYVSQLNLTKLPKFFGCK